jgi:hypothetical protein
LLKKVYIVPFLITHEIVEKALLDELRLHYLHAHQIALRIERAAVEAAGVSWSTYEGFMKKHEKAIESEKIQRVPRNLDLTPYRDEQDFALLRQLATGKRGQTRKKSRFDRGDERQLRVDPRVFSLAFLLVASVLLRVAISRCQ